MTVEAVTESFYRSADSETSNEFSTVSDFSVAGDEGSFTLKLANTQRRELAEGFFRPARYSDDELRAETISSVCSKNADALHDLLDHLTFQKRDSLVASLVPIR